MRQLFWSAGADEKLEIIFICSNDPWTKVEVWKQKSKFDSKSRSLKNTSQNFKIKSRCFKNKSQSFFIKSPSLKKIYED